MPQDAGIAVRDVDVELSQSPILSGVDVTAAPGQSLALLGPSGCGKTTLLRVVAGLQSIGRGQVYIDGTMVAGPGVNVAPEDRAIGMVFQDWALFPHLTVMQNILFGLPRAERKTPPVEVMTLLEMVGITELADRRPGSLSGGQKQRVALARALAPKPAALLLDEPFSSLDTTLRVEVRSEVSDLLRLLGVTTIFVTHDQDEAFVLGDEVAVMRHGTVVQQATPADLYARPADRWLAGFIGEADTITGVATGSTADTPLGRIPLHEPATGTVDVLVRPEELRLRSITDGADSPTITSVQFFGHDTLYSIAGVDGVSLRCRMTGSPRFDVGQRVAVEHSGVTATAFDRPS